jgi:glycosyltransferase involved in cell wall biosynthesis
VPSASHPALLLLLRDAEQTARCLRALATAGLPDDLVVLAGGAPAVRMTLQELGGFLNARWLDGAGAALVNTGVTAVDSDLILLDGATEVGQDFYAELLAVAAAEPDAATVTPLSNDAGFLSVPRRNLPWPLPSGGLTAAQAASRLRAGALGLHPRIPTALAHTTLLRRAAFQLVGPLDETLSLHDALGDFCARATAAGLAHVVADELFVAHRGAIPDGTTAGWEGEVAARHQALGPAVAAVAQDRHSALARALLAASVALEPLTVTVDARNVAGAVNGSVVHVVELLGALAARDDVRVRALLPAQVGADAARALERMPTLERLTTDAAEDDGVARTHVAHRPWQVESVADMALLDRLGERTVLTHQDLIGYRTPDVFASVDAWQDYRATTVDALGLAAMVLFFSEAAAHDAAAEDLVAPERGRVVPIGATPELLSDDNSIVPPALTSRDRPFLLVLGARFRHKNVRFALELLGALRDEHGWDGELVLAGGDVLNGSGSADDAAWLLRAPEHAGAVVELGAVSQGEKAWLLANAAAVVYPSTYEGFGLVPFEAAQVGTPALVAPASALRETVPEPLALLTPWDAQASAARVAPVLADGAPRTELVDGLRAAAAALTWERTGGLLVAAYHDAVRLPATPAARLAADLARAERDYWSVRDGIPDEAWPLVKPEDPLVDIPLARDLVALLRSGGGRQRLLRAMKLARRLPGRS